MNNENEIEQRYEKAIKAEKTAKRKLKLLAAKIAEATAPIAHWGDGDCGYVINIIVDEFEKRGLYKGYAKNIQRVRGLK